MKNSAISAFVCFIAVTHLRLTEADELRKRYTLKLPVTLPIGGPYAPLGALCTEPIDLLLSIVNNRSDILPNYNLVVDLVDDECTDTVVRARMLPSLLSGVRVTNVSAPDGYFGQYLLPKNFQFRHTTAELGYIPPLLIGSMCSGVCTVMARYMAFFDFINFSAACNVPSLGDRKLYPNFYRVASDNQLLVDTALFLSAMNWKKVAIISDTTVSNFKNTADSISIYYRYNISLIATEFYFDDASEAVARVKASGARVIVANCYFDLCMELICRAYQNKLYGPHIIWIFPAITDLQPPPYCTREMVATFYKGAFAYRQIAPDYQSTPSQIGLTGAQLDSYLGSVVTNLTSHPFYGSRWMCFDNVMPGIYILDSTEKMLNKRGSTLRNYIEDDSKSEELRELVRQATTSLDIRIFSGPMRYESGAHEILLPAGFEQVQQNGVHKTVFIDNGADALDNKIQRYQFKEPFMWSTKDGKPPKLEMTVVIRNRHVPSEAAAFFTAISGLITILSGVSFALQLSLRNDKQIDKTQAALSGITLLGIVSILSAIFTFPLRPTATSMINFCREAPVLVIFGYSMLNGALFAKFALFSSSKPADASNNEQAKSHHQASKHNTKRDANSSSANKSRRIQKLKTTSSCFILWICLNIALLAFWYKTDGMPTTKTLIISRYETDSDTLWQDVWESCVAASSPVAAAIPNITPADEQTKETDTSMSFLYLNIGAGGIICLQGFCLLILFFTALMKRQNLSTELSHTVRTVYILFPATIAAILTVNIAPTPDVVYYLLSSIVIAQSTAITLLLFVKKEEIYRQGVRVVSLLKNNAGRITEHRHPQLMQGQQINRHSSSASIVTPKSTRNNVGFEMN